MEVPKPSAVPLSKGNEEGDNPPSAAELAGRLAEKLRGVFAGKKARITRPSETAEMRLRGLDDSVTPRDVTLAIMALGGVVEEDLRIGEIRTVWMRCPVATARKAVDAGKLPWDGRWQLLSCLAPAPSSAIAA